MARNIVLSAFLFLLVATIAVCLSSQRADQPSVASVAGVPSEPVAPGTCTYSTSGYLGKNGKTKLTDSELGRMIYTDLKMGYVDTIYPPTKNGIFDYSECAGAIVSKDAKRP